jgi:hypothetical protein
MERRSRLVQLSGSIKRRGADTKAGNYLLQLSPLSIFRWALCNHVTFSMIITVQGVVDSVTFNYG